MKSGWILKPRMEDTKKQMKSWIRSQHLICVGTDFIFETVDQTQLDKFETSIQAIGGRIRTVKAIGNWPMGPRSCLLYTSPSPRDQRGSRMPSSA